MIMIRSALFAGWMLVLAGCGAPLSGDDEATLGLEDLAAGRAPSRLKSSVPSPVRETIQYSVNGRRYTGDVYRPAQGALAGIVLVPGVVPQGKDDARLVALATTLARLRFAVLTPDMAGPRGFRVRAGDVREVVDAFTYLASRIEFAPQGRAGIAGFSYGAGPVLLAGLDPAIRDRVRYILSVGGYHDLRSALAFFTTGDYPLEDQSDAARVVPHGYPKAVFTYSNADLLERPSDRGVLRALATDFLGEFEPDLLEVPPRLATDAAALYALVTNTDAARVPALIEALSPRIRAEVRALNPAEHDLSQMRARVILLHGRSDNLIPYTESVALARALPPGQVRLYLIDGLAHVDLRPVRQDLPSLIQAMRALLAERAIPGKSG